MLPQPTVPLQAALVARDASSRPDTFYHSTAAAQCAVLPVGLDPVEARQKRRADDAHACAPYAHAPMLDRLARVEAVLVRARDRAAASDSPLPFLDGWEIFHQA